MIRKSYPLILGLSLALLAGFGLSQLQAPPAHADPGIGGPIALPILNHTGDVQTAGAGVVLQVQNLGITATQAALFLWPAYTGFCEPQATGPQKLECSGILGPGSTWVWTGQQLPAWAASGTVIAVRVGSCSTITPTLLAALGRDPVYLPPEPIPPLAVDVTRRVPGDVSPEVLVSSSYGGLSVAEVGTGDPIFGGFSYYAPTVLVNALGFNSRIYLQNLGDSCTSVELWLRAEDDCLRAQICEVMALAPGETYILDPATCIGGPFRGSAWIRASQPLGVMVEQFGQDTLSSYAGVASHVVAGQATAQSGSQVNYGPLIFREFQGWETSITVQNLSATLNAAVKVYFLDASGDIITTVMDWVCPRGSQTFFLPVINGLPGMYVGSVRVESQASFTYPSPPNITSVATLTKFEGPARAQTLEAISYNLLTEQEAFDWQSGCAPDSPNWPDCYSGVGLIGIPSLLKDKLGATSEIAIQNINPNPGFTDFAIYFFDQNGLLDYVCQKLNEKQVEYIDLDTWGYIPPGFMGSAVISATYTNQAGGFGLAAVVVERMGPIIGGDVPGDESNGHAAIPVAGAFRLQNQEPLMPVCPGQPPAATPTWTPTPTATPTATPTFTPTPTATPTATAQVFTLDGYAHTGSNCVPGVSDGRLVGRKVELWDGTGTTKLDETTTDHSDGYFEFTVTAGSYELKILNAAGTISESSGQIPVSANTRRNYRNGLDDVPNGDWCEPVPTD